MPGVCCLVSLSCCLSAELLSSRCVASAEVTARPPAVSLARLFENRDEAGPEGYTVRFLNFRAWFPVWPMTPCCASRAPGWIIDQPGVVLSFNVTITRLRTYRCASPRPTIRATMTSVGNSRSAIPGAIDRSSAGSYAHGARLARGSSILLIRRRIAAPDLADWRFRPRRGRSR
jgi:hypothetical protein